MKKVLLVMSLLCGQCYGAYGPINPEILHSRLLDHATYSCRDVKDTSFWSGFIGGFLANAISDDSLYEKTISNSLGIAIVGCFNIMTYSDFRTQCRVEHTKYNGDTIGYGKFPADFLEAQSITNPDYYTARVATGYLLGSCAGYLARAGAIKGWQGLRQSFAWCTGVKEKEEEKQIQEAAAPAPQVAAA